jgi:2-dehydro-3-deoxygalactonokinase
MPDLPIITDHDAVILVDTGTTNTRLWLVQNGTTLAKASAQCGAGDSARTGSNELLKKTLRDLIQQVRADQPTPKCVMAAGMITSALGLLEVPHVQAPAGLDLIRDATRAYEFPDVTDLPFVLVPGVRTGEKHCALATAGETDVMRGEETLCLGLLATDIAKPPTTLLNLGSHWKVISIDASGRIERSRTSLSGEMMHVIQTGTILAGSLPVKGFDEIDPAAVRIGIERAMTDGLPRALFSIRLAQLGGNSSESQRYSFFLGAFIACDLSALKNARYFNDSVLLAGHPAVCAAWQVGLEMSSIKSTRLSESQIERATHAGLLHIL